jgi:hypothetical protein
LCTSLSFPVLSSYQVMLSSSEITIWSSLLNFYSVQTLHLPNTCWVMILFWEYVVISHCSPVSHLKSFPLTRWCYPPLKLLSGVVYYISILFGHFSYTILAGYDPILRMYGNFTLFDKRYCCTPDSHLKSISLTRWCYPPLKLLSRVAC